MSATLPVAGVAIDEVLVEFAMWLTQRDVRRQKANALASDGATPEAIRVVCEFVERGAGHDPELTGKRLALILVPVAWREAHTAAQAAAERAPAAEEWHERNQWAPQPVSPQQLDQWVCGTAYTRLRYDGAKPEVVAEELGLSAAELRKHAVQGAAMYGAADPEAVVARIFEPARRVRR